MRSGLFSFVVLVLLSVVIGGCKDKKQKIKYEFGFFPDSVFNLEGLNTVYDDFNVSAEVDEYYSLSATVPVIFSSNRNSSGGQFDLVYGEIKYTFDKVSGDFTLGSELFTDSFYNMLTARFNTPGDDLGPNRLFYSGDGMEYMFVSSATASDGLDIMYSRYTPYVHTLPSVPEPAGAILFNSSYNDAYVSFSGGFDTAYFCTDRGGDFDICYYVRPAQTSFSSWLTSASQTLFVADSINSVSDEKCPNVAGKIMVFASDADGGYGGFDLYCSVFRNGKWSSPVNLGDRINSEANEYRPFIGTDNNYSNRFIIFSSDREGGKGGYDLYLSPLNAD